MAEPLPERGPATVLAVVSDLIFATRITGTARQVGAACRVVQTPDALNRALIEGQSPAFALALVDLHVEGLSGVDAVRAIKEARPRTRVVAFLSHVERELAARARDAGADDVLPRSAFVQRLPALLGGDRTGGAK